LWVTGILQHELIQEIRNPRCIVGDVQHGLQATAAAAAAAAATAAAAVNIRLHTLSASVPFVRTNSSSKLQPVMRRW
jgi:hypothetical protein